VCFGTAVVGDPGKNDVADADVDGVELHCHRIGDGEGSSIRQVKQMMIRNSRLACDGATLGRETGVLWLESTRTDSRSEASAVCLGAKEMVLAVNVTGRTGTRQFYRADRIPLEKAHSLHCVIVPPRMPKEKQFILQWRVISDSFRLGAFTNAVRDTRKSGTIASLESRTEALYQKVKLSLQSLHFTI
jgi:hypothetical protein